MATINYDYCEEEDLYNSGDIEEQLLEIYKTGRKATIIDNTDFFYTVTPIRENIINWYDFKKDATILEVGGGLGAVTGELCRKAKKVVSNEYSKRRAENIYYRHKECENLEVIVGNLNKIHFNEKFDYIILIGVFEYAKRFCRTKKPFHDFLNNLKNLLKENGVILIAIENRYGIKYFAGATEDHYGEKYLGLYGYDTKDIQTLGKEELSSIIKKCGFNYHKYYYPYPDYKMPYIIYTDERLPLKTEVLDLFLYNHGVQYYDYDYRKILPGIIDNNQYGFFANSFMVEMTNDKDSISKVKYAKSSLIRAEEYQVNTIIEENNRIKKIAKYSSASRHLDNMIKINDDLKQLGLKVAEIKKKENSYEVEYIEGNTITEYILNLTKEKNIDLIKQEINKYYDLLKQISVKSDIKQFAIQEEKEYFGDKQIEILKVGLFDLHCSNIIKKDDNYYIIDQEWCSEFDIPLNYMLYFGISYLFKWVENLDTLLDIEDIYKEYNISKEEREIYNLMSIYISKNECNNVDEETLKLVMQQNIYKDMKMVQQETECKIKEMQREMEETRIEQNKYIVKQQELIKENNELKTMVDNQAEKIEQIEEELKKSEEESEQLKFENTLIAQENEEMKKSIKNFEESKSWKLTAPLRKINGKLNKKE